MAQVGSPPGGPPQSVGGVGIPCLPPRCAAASHAPRLRPGAWRVCALPVRGHLPVRGRTRALRRASPSAAGPHSCHRDEADLPRADAGAGARPGPCTGLYPPPCCSGPSPLPEACRGATRCGAPEAGPPHRRCHNPQSPTLRPEHGRLAAHGVGKHLHGRGKAAPFPFFPHPSLCWLLPCPRLLQPGFAARWSAPARRCAASASPPTSLSRSELRRSARRCCPPSTPACRPPADWGCSAPRCARSRLPRPPPPATRSLPARSDAKTVFATTPPLSLL